MLSPDGTINTPDGPKQLTCPIEYVILRAVRFMKGAMKPCDFLSDFDPLAWAEFAVMSEAVEEEVYRIKNPPPKGKAAPMKFNLREPS